jgi:GrpB-like predicted nucleotidyltransferase (UPF0157 family)
MAWTPPSGAAAAEDPEGIEHTGFNAGPGYHAGVADGADLGLTGWLRAAGIDPDALAAGTISPWHAWLMLRERWGRRATLVDLYELEAVARGIAVGVLPDALRAELKAAARPLLFPGRGAVLPGTDRGGDPHELTAYDPGWPAQYARWRDRLAAALGRAPHRIEHVGSTAVPGLAAKPVIDILISVPDIAAEAEYLPAVRQAGLVLRSRDAGHLFLWPPPAEPRAVHVHVAAGGGRWERDHLLFRDYLRVQPAARDRYGRHKLALISRWRHDRLAYTQAKTGCVLDILGRAEAWAAATGWAPG